MASSTKMRDARNAPIQARPIIKVAMIADIASLLDF